MVPHLATALTGPLLALEKRFLDAETTIERWLRGQWLEHTPPFYCSVDLRNSGFKLAPVDTNLFPGGFNNLNPAFLPLCVQATMTAVEKICPEAKNLLLVPENHTRNQFYLMNVARLAAILHHTGLNVRIGSLLPEIDKPTTLTLPDDQTLTLEPLQRFGSIGAFLDVDRRNDLLNPVRGSFHRLEFRVYERSFLSDADLMFDTETDGDEKSTSTSAPDNTDSVSELIGTPMGPIPATSPASFPRRP